MDGSALGPVVIDRETRSPAPGQNDSMREQVKDRTSTCKGGGQGSGEKQEENRLEMRGIKGRPGRQS
jgi:hypothetical protein